MSFREIQRLASFSSPVVNQDSWYTLDLQFGVQRDDWTVSFFVDNVTGNDTFRTGGHWPTDQLGGLLIGLALVVAIWAVRRPSHLHDSCNNSCPAVAEQQHSS